MMLILSSSLLLFTGVLFLFFIINSSIVQGLFISRCCRWF